MILDFPNKARFSTGEENLWNALCRFNSSTPDQMQQQKSRRLFHKIIGFAQSEAISLQLVPNVFLKGPYDLREADYVRSGQILQQSTDKKNQFILLDSVPKSDIEVQRQFKSGFPIALDSFIGAQLSNNVNIDDLYQCKSAVELKNKIHLLIMQNTFGVDFSALVKGMETLFSEGIKKTKAEKPFTLQNRKEIAVFLIRMLEINSEKERCCQAYHVSAVIGLLHSINNLGGVGILNACISQGQFSDFNVSPSEYVGFLQNLNELLMQKTRKISVINMMRQVIPSCELIQKCKNEYDDFFGNKYQEKSIQLLKNDFLHVENSIHPDVLTLLLQDYAQIHLDYSKVKTWSDIEIKAFTDAFQLKAVQQPPEHHEKLLLVAVLRESIRRHFGILPHNTQIIAFLGAIHHLLYDINHTNLIADSIDIKGHIPQVNTGEGKSTIVALKAAFFALHGRSIDIITSSSSLAVRDFKKYDNFYQFFGISSSHICVDRPEAKDYSGQIVYGQNTDFEFGYLRQQLYFDTARSKRIFDIAIVDEIDNMLIDKGRNNSIISIGENNASRFLLKPIYEIVSQAVLISSSVNADLLMQELYKNAANHVYSDEVIDLLKRFDESQVKSWFSSCIQALLELEENVDYIVDKLGADNQQQIIIIDKATGKQESGSRWQNKLHEFVEMKHKLPVNPESYTGAEISHPVFYSFYKTIFGLTGTLGSSMERQELLDNFKIGSFDVPPHHMNKRKTLKPHILATELDQFQMIANEISEIKKSNRPILILTDTIDLSSRLNAFLTMQGIPTQCLNSLQKENEEFIIGRAGVAGQVTVATNTASRGTDIDVSQMVKNAGGLHVVMAYYPENERVELQGVGRAARQGVAGSSRLILAKTRLPFNLDNIDSTSDEDVLENLQFNRMLNDFKNMQQRQFLVSKNFKSQDFLAQFYTKLQHLNQTLDSDFLTALARKSDLRSPNLEAVKYVASYNSDKLKYSSLSQSEKQLFLQNQKTLLLYQVKQLWGEIYSSVNRADLQDGLDFAQQQFNVKLAGLLDEPATGFETFCCLNSI